MKTILTIIIIACFMFSASGCSLFMAKDIKNLKRRVNALEDRETIVEEKVEADTGKSVTYVSSTEVKETAPRVDSRSMTKKEIQVALRNAGYYNGPIDGKLGTKSRKAIRDFQQDNGLKVDGIAGTQTKKALAKYLNYIK